MRNMKSLDVIVRESCLKTTRSLHVNTMKPYSRTNTKSFAPAAPITENRLSYRHHHNLSHLRERTVLRDPHFLSQGQLPVKRLELTVATVPATTSKPINTNCRTTPTTLYFPPTRTFASSNRSNFLSEDPTKTKSSPQDEAERMNQLHQAKNIFKKADAICFDVDSTVIQDEAIDELAKFCGKGREVEELTQEAMKGGMDFREALALRLDLIRPNLLQLRNYILSTKQRLSPYVKELIHELHKRGKEVYLISGGFRSIILPLAEDLQIPSANVFANKLKFYHDGEYAGFDENQLTSRTGGKGSVIRNLKERHGYETVVMIGDGITDWEAAPPADLFIGFGGNAYRYEVKSRAKWYITDFRDLINELKNDVPVPGERY